MLKSDANKTIEFNALYLVYRWYTMYTFLYVCLCKYQCIYWIYIQQQYTN